MKIVAIAIGAHGTTASVPIFGGIYEAALVCALGAAVAAAGGATRGDEARGEVSINEYRGRQTREDVFEFAEKPRVERQGDKWVITFAGKGMCDATAAIVDKDGKIVRHLASGVLGKNAPWPFKQDSLTQSLEWDGKDDRGQPAPEGCKVKVGLGLKTTLDRYIGDEPRLNAGGLVMACDGAGNVYSVADDGSSRITVLDR